MLEMNVVFSVDQKITNWLLLVWRIEKSIFHAK